MERWRSARGQASSEYVALVALVAVVLTLAAGLTSGGVGGQVLAGVQRGLCTIVGRACPPQPPAGPDLAPCPLERTTRSESLDGAVEVLALGRSGTLSAVRGSDGRVTVTLADAASDGFEVGVGVKAGIGGRHDADATAGLSTSFSTGRSWTLPDAAAARAFVARYGAKATVGGQAVDVVRGGCSLLCDAIGWRPHAELPPPDESYVSQGAAARAEASLGPATAQASGGRLLGAALGRDGGSTWFLQLDTAASAAIGGAVGTLGIVGQTQTVVSYALDADHRPVSLVIHTVTRGGVDGAVRIGRGGGRASADAGRALVTEADQTLDLHDARNRAAAAGFVAALRDPRALGALPSRMATVRERVALTGSVDRRIYALDSFAYALGLKLRLGAQLGGGFERTHEGMHLLSAETRLPGLPFLPRDDCRPA
jgi:hypothetical protein